MNQPGISTAEAPVIQRAVEQFCAREGRRCYGAFTPEVLRDYLAWHFDHGTIAWVREGQPTPGQWRITGVGVAWPTDPEDLFRAHCQTRHAFDWNYNERGRALFIADVVATTPRAVAALLQKFNARFPGWQQRGLYTYRRGKLIYLTPHTLVRLYRRAVATNPQPSTKD